MWLTIRTGEGAGTGVELVPGDGVLVGRDPSCDLPLDSDQVSRRHAHISLAGDGAASLQDLGSTNGTFVNGHRIGGTVVLEGSEELKFGDVAVQLSPAPLPEGAITRDARVGTVLGKYQIQDLIATGAMGMVYLAEHANTGRPVALKVLSPAQFSDERSRARFIQESRAAGSIEHPNIIDIYDADEIEGQLYIAMRRVRGVDLGTLIAEGPLEPMRALHILDQVAAALDAAHSHGLVHRDVKPGNILVTGADDPTGPDHAFLCDFGISKDTTSDSGLTVAGAPPGTRAYMAPEQFRAEKADDVDGRADEYALACVLFESLTGARPFQRDTDEQYMYAHLEAPRPKVSDVRPDLPIALDEVIARGLAAKRDDRFGSCVGLLQAARATFAPSASPTAPSAIPPTDAGTPTLSPTAAPAGETRADASAASPLAPAATASAGGPVAPSSTPPPPGSGSPANARKGPPKGLIIAGAVVAALLVIGALAYALSPTKVIVTPGPQVPPTAPPTGTGPPSSAAPVAGPRLEGTWNVTSSYTQAKGWANSSGIRPGAEQEWTMEFTPRCESGACDVTLVIPFRGADIFGDLTYDGTHYSGTLKEGAIANCGEPTLKDEQTIDITVSATSEDQQTATNIAGTMAEESPAVRSCVATSFTADLAGTPSA